MFDFGWGSKNASSRGFSHRLVFLSASESSLTKGNSFLPLFPLSVAADTHIHLASENPLTAPILAHWVCQSIHPMGGTQGNGSLRLKERAKQFVMQALLPVWLPCWPQWKVANGSDYLLVTLPAGSPVCQPCWAAGTLSLWVFCLKMPGSLSFSLSPYHSETFLIAFLIWESKGLLNKMGKQPVNWVITKASLVSYCHRGGGTSTKKRKWRHLRVFQNFWK